ncbi:unnamed protein product [Microthlaspi erraticum]|uniref:Arabidopsis retrotransposon Orf1 C-terminal domain-containing protein n=1 Tax=Microthlaspi erraticum TaxID=1685480 RepID=A0A6D2JV60_9BRAS|nr:unnamed protein product [Microthlaspi erraticum]
MTNSEGSRASQRRMVEGESSNARERRLKMQADLEAMTQRMEESDAEEYVYSEEESESERLREERRTKKRNDPIKDGDGSPSEEGSDESESEEEGEEVNQLVDESEQESNQDEPMEEAEPQEEEEELPMYQEHYNALFSMDFVETKYPQDDTMRTLGIFEDVELVLKNMQLARFFSHRMESYKELTCEFLASMRYHQYDELDRAELDQGWSYSQKSEDCPDGSIENQRPTGRRLAEERMFRARPKPSVRLKSRPKFVSGRSHHDPGNMSRGRPRHNHSRQPHTTSRASREQSLAAAQPLAYHGRCIRPSREDVPRPAENHRPISSVRPQPADEKSSGHDRSDSTTTRLSGRPSRPTVRTPRSSPKPAPTSKIRCQALKHHHLHGIVLQDYLLEDQEETSSYLEAADLETSSQAASQEEHLLATPEEEIDPELIEFVKRDQFHDLFSEYALEHIDHFDNLCDSYGVFDFEKKMMLFSTSLAGPALDWAQHDHSLQSSHGSILEKLS